MRRPQSGATALAWAPCEAPPLTLRTISHKPDRSQQFPRIKCVAGALNVGRGTFYKVVVTMPQSKP